MTDCKTCGKTGLQPDAIHTCTPLALRLADALDHDPMPMGWYQEAAAELRRLSAERDELLEVLKRVEFAFSPLAKDCTLAGLVDEARAAIAKATGDQA